MAVQGTEPTSSANIKALTDNLKTWVTGQIKTAIDSLKKGGTLLNYKTLYKGAVKGKRYALADSINNYDMVIVFLEKSGDPLDEPIIKNMVGRTGELTVYKDSSNGVYINGSVMTSNSLASTPYPRLVIGIKF